MWGGFTGTPEEPKLEEAGLVQKRKSKNGSESWNRTWFSERMPLTRDTVIKIVKVVDPSYNQFDFADVLEEDSLATFFVMLQALADNLRQAGESPRVTGFILSETELFRRKQSLISQKCGYWDIPKKHSDKNDIVHRPEQTMAMLRALDYGNQQFGFSEALKKSSGFAAFLIPAPCARSQLWAIDRLSHSINNQARITRIPLFNVSQDPIRSRGMDELWKQLGIKLDVSQNDQRSQEKIKQKLLRSKRPVVIALYNFGEEDITPHEVIESFWEPLISGAENPSKDMRSQVILLMADGKADTYKANGVEPLKPLHSIAHQDIKAWLADDVVNRWLGGSNFTVLERKKFTDLVTKEEEWVKCSPGKVLDKICFGLGLTNGAEDLHRKWKQS
jgi:hypothetical protein